MSCDKMREVQASAKRDSIFRIHYALDKIHSRPLRSINLMLKDIWPDLGNKLLPPE